MVSTPASLRPLTSPSRLKPIGSLPVQPEMSTEDRRLRELKDQEDQQKKKDGLERQAKSRLYRKMFDLPETTEELVDGASSERERN